MEQQTPSQKLILGCLLLLLIVLLVITLFYSMIHGAGNGLVLLALGIMILVTRTAMRVEDLHEKIDKMAEPEKEE